MAKKVEETNLDFDLDLGQEDNKEQLNISDNTEELSAQIFAVEKSDEGFINPLKSERVVVRFLPKTYLRVTDPKHVLYGGMAEGSKRTFVVPVNTAGSFIEVLSKSEQAYLEEFMGYPTGTLSASRRKNNFFSMGNPEGISKVVLEKRDNYLDLSIPEDFIKYKILLANKDTIAPSLKHMQNYPKATYQFVIISEGEEQSRESENLNSIQKSYMEFGKIDSDYDKLKFIVETIEGKPLARGTKIDFIKSRINAIIQSNSKLFLAAATDNLLDTKVVIKKAVESGIISMRGNFLYLTEGNIPLCGNNAEPTLNNAAQFLNLPKNQDMLLTIQAKLKL